MYGIRGNLYKKRPFYIVGINNFNKKINKETDNSNTIGISNKFSNKVASPSNILKSPNLLENVRKRNTFCICLLKKESSIMT